MINNKLNDILQQINAATQQANTDIETIPMRSRPAWGIAITEAKERLVTLRKDYGFELLQNVVAIYVEGDATKASVFATVAENELGTFWVPFSVLYTDIASRIEKQIGANRQFLGTHGELVMSIVNEQCLRFGMHGNSALKFGELPVVPDFTSLVAYVRQVVTSGCGDDLALQYFLERVVSQALEEQYNDKVVPLIITDFTESERHFLNGIFNRHSATIQISTEDNVNKQYVIKSLNKVKKTLTETSDNN